MIHPIWMANNSLLWYYTIVVYIHINSNIVVIQLNRLLKNSKAPSPYHLTSTPDTCTQTRPTTNGTRPHIARIRSCCCCCCKCVQVSVCRYDKLCVRLRARSRHHDDANAPLTFLSINIIINTTCCVFESVYICTAYRRCMWCCTLRLLYI